MQLLPSKSLIRSVIRVLSGRQANDESTAGTRKVNTVEQTSWQSIGTFDCDVMSILAICANGMEVAAESVPAIAHCHRRHNTTHQPGCISSLLRRRCSIASYE